MPRDFFVNGPCMVSVRGNGNLGTSNPVNSFIPTTSELGLTSDAIHISPNYLHREIHVDDFGPEVPAEVLFNLSSVDLQMTLVHFDETVLNRCVDESMGGSIDSNEMVAGRALGNGKPLGWSGNRYIEVKLASPDQQRPWDFLSCYLTGPAVRFPLGTTRSLVQLNWRAIPYGFVSGGPIQSDAFGLYEAFNSYPDQRPKSKDIVSRDFRIWRRLF